jgi:hypothetical protein
LSLLYEFIAGPKADNIIVKSAINVKGLDLTPTEEFRERD